MKKNFVAPLTICCGDKILHQKRKINYKKNSF